MLIFNFRIYFFCLVFSFFAITGIFAQSLLSEKYYKSNNSEIVNSQINNFFLQPNLDYIQQLDSDKFFNSILDTSNIEKRYSVENQQLILLLHQAVELLSESKQRETLILLKDFSFTQIQKNALFESYFFLLSYLSFFQKKYQENYSFSKEYLENFSNYQGVYTIFYFHLYSALITNQEFLFEPIIRKQDFLSTIPKVLQKPMGRLIIEYAHIRGKYDLSIEYLKMLDGNELLLESIEKSYAPKLLENYQKIFSEKKIKEEIFFRQTQLLYYNRKDEEVQKNLEEVFQNKKQYSKKIIKKFSRLKTQLQQERAPIKIGILLPFSVQNPTIQNIIKQAQTSINIFFGEHSRYYEFYFMDTALKANVTKENYQKLVDKEVLAVIGPIARINVQSILEQSTQEQVPILSLTQSEYIGVNYPYAYRYQRNRVRENKFLVNYAVDYLQAKNIVAFYDSQATLQDVLSFQEELKKKGSKLFTIEKVTFDKINIQNNFRNLTGIYRYLNRYEEKAYESLEEQNLTPTRIDALYLPFSLEKIRLIHSFLSSYGLQSSYLLANGSVNNIEIGNYNFLRFYFADKFFYDSQQLLGKKYSDYYLLTGNEQEKLQVYGVIVYELLELIDQLVTKFDVKNPQELKYYLDRINQFSFLETPLKVSKQGEISKKYNIYRLYKNKIQPVF